MNRFLPLLFLTVTLSVNGWAQIIPDGESVGDMVIYRNEMHGGAYLHSSGIGAFYRKGKILTAKRSRFWEVDITNIKHPKSYRGINPFEESARQYVFGKLNSFAIIRPGIGYNNVLHGKDRRKGVEVRYHYYGGPSIGLAKPVYLEIIVPEGNARKVVTQRYNPDQHHLDNIYGRAPFTRGLGETRIHPGLYGKFGFSFEYSGYDDLIKAIETGIVVDAYAKKIPIMALTENNQVFVNFYISFVIGKREF